MEGDISPTLKLVLTVISIHALRMEGDVGPNETVRDEEISIHALRMEGDSKNEQIRL